MVENSGVPRILEPGSRCCRGRGKLGGKGPGGGCVPPGKYLPISCFILMHSDTFLTLLNHNVYHGRAHHWSKAMSRCRQVRTKQKNKLRLFRSLIILFFSVFSCGVALFTCELATWKRNEVDVFMVSVWKTAKATRLPTKPRTQTRPLIMSTTNLYSEQPGVITWWCDTDTGPAVTASRSEPDTDPAVMASESTSPYHDSVASS